MQDAFPKFLGGHAGLAQLADLLENEQLWRDKLMHWDFDTVLSREQSYAKEALRRLPREKWCGSAGCAIGLARSIWPKEFDSRTTAEIFNIDFATCKKIFFSAMTYNPYDNFDKVSPGDVARAIRDYLATHTSHAE